jgi:hypothetical protein
VTTANQAPRRLLPTWRAAASLGGQAVRFAAVGIISTIASVASQERLIPGPAAECEAVFALGDRFLTRANPTRL